jgi:photosystem II stability/assembly factor-like uncharacterized protein
MNFFLRLTIILILSSINTLTVAQNGWESIDSPTDQLLRNLYFVDEDFGWAAGRNGTLIRTTNSGDEWTILNTGITSTIYDLFFLNNNLGWLVSFPFTPPYFTKILKTTDGGDSWDIQNYPDEFIFFRTIHFIDSLIGFMGGDFIARTTDGGESWNRMHVDSSLISDYPVIKFKFYDDQLGYASGGSRDQAGVMWRTTDGGFNWSAEGVSPDEVFDFHIKDSLNVLALSGDPEFIYPVALVRTTDSGQNWITSEIQFFTLSYALDFRTESEGWSASGIYFMVTSDGGESWELKVTPDSIGIFDLQFVNDTLGFACGENGKLLRYDGTILQINDELDNSISDYSLRQNYPNPFNSNTHIKFVIPASFIHNSEYVKLIIYDILGNTVQTLIDEELSAGTYEVEFNSGKLSSGLYFYSLTTGNFSETKKMILLR